ncbi:MAG: hypothetical protein EOO93_04655 [Pedobacter sp.]|nr:MAG: hypothetical protein EOO93_04655 [Pedobacter sp.]
MKNIIIIIELILSSYALNAQVKPIYFYGDQLTNDKDKATSYAVYGKVSTDSVWSFKRYDLYDNLLQTGSYSDETLTVAHGKFTFYADIIQFNNVYSERFVIKGKTRFVAQEGNFVNGLEQGKWLVFFPDGNIFSSQEFVDGKLHGKFITYNRYGVEVTNGNFVTGEKHGEWLLEKGTIREIWNMGVLVSRENIKKKKTVKGTVTNKNS